MLDKSSLPTSLPPAMLSSPPTAALAPHPAEPGVGRRFSTDPPTGTLVAPAQLRHHLEPRPTPPSTTPRAAGRAQSIFCGRTTAVRHHRSQLAIICRSAWCSGGHSPLRVRSRETPPWTRPTMRCPPHARSSESSPHQLKTFHACCLTLALTRGGRYKPEGLERVRHFNPALQRTPRPTAGAARR